MRNTFANANPQDQEHIIDMIKELSGVMIVQSGPSKVLNMSGKSSSGMDFVEVNVDALADLLTSLF